MTAHPFPAAMRADAVEAEYLLLPSAAPRPQRVGLAMWIALAMMLSAAAASIWVFFPSRDVAAVDIDLGPAMPVELLAATRGEQGARVTEGAEAQAINAALPFASGAIEAARPFALSAGSMSDHQRALHCLTQAVYYEAGFEPIEGRRAVAQVVLNRVRHPAFPNSVCGVVYDGSSRPGCQFSFTCDGSLRRPPAAGAWAAAQTIAREALSGQVTTAVGNATHYHANYVSPYWAPRLTKLSQIGAHIFYRWPGAWGRGGAFTSRYAGAEVIARPPSLMAQADELAMVEMMPPPDPTDRRAENDVGGRLDVTRGWTLSIPHPSETGSQFAAAMNRQGNATPAASGAGAEVQERAQ